MDTTGEKEKRNSKKNAAGSTGSHDNKKLRTRSMEKLRGMTIVHSPKKYTFYETWKNFKFT